MRNSTLSLPDVDTTLKVLLTFIGIFSILLLFLIFGFVTREALPAFEFVGVKRFFADASWYPLEGQFDLKPMLLGTLGVSLGAMLIAGPIGIASAVFCQFYAGRRTKGFYRGMIEILAGIPSVVYGFWGLVTLVPFLGLFFSSGHSLLAGALVLAIMILPTVVLLVDSCLSNVPKEYVRGAYALGLSRWGVIRRVVLPASSLGIVTSLILSMARALGETMAVLMVCGNIARIPDSVFSPVRTLTANIALEMAYAMDLHQSTLYVSGLLLLVFVGVLFFSSTLFSRGSVGGRG